MVNSKKMSKSSIAVIVLSILLVLSMILGLTGAWFTADGSYAGKPENNLTIRNGWMEVSLAGDGNGSLYATRANKEEHIDNDKVMPGDWVHITGERLTVTTKYVTFTSGAKDETATGGAGAANVKAHVFIVDKDNKEVAYKEMTADSDSSLTYDIPVADLANGNANLTAVDGKPGVYLVNQSLEATAAGTEIAKFSISNYSVKAIQVENLDKAAAAEALGITLAA